MLLLIVAGGPDKGRIFELINDTEVVLGRETEKVRFNDPKCSRKHARLFREGDDWYIEDNHSRHGTYRNHKPIDGKTRVKDGDYLQVGSTVLVVGRMATEHAERLALVGQPKSPPAPPRTKPAWVVGSALAAAAVVIAFNAVLHFSQPQPRQPIVTEMAQETRQIEQLVERIDQRVARETEEQKARDQVLGDILATVSQTPDAAEMKQRLDAILTRFDTLPDHGEQLTALASAIESQPRYDEQLTSLARAVENLPDYDQKLDALAAALDARPDLSQQITQLAERTAENAQMLASMDQRLGEGVRVDADAVMARIDQSLGEVLDEMKAQRDAAAGSDQLMLALAQNQKHVDSMFTQVLERLGEQPSSEQLVADLRDELESNWGQSPKRTTRLLDDLLAELQKQPSVEELSAAMAAAQTESGEATTELLQQIMAKVEAQEAVAAQLEEVQRLVKADDASTLEPMLADMLRKLESVGQRPEPDNSEVLAAIADLREARPAGDAEWLASLAEEVQRLADAHRDSLMTQDLLDSALGAAQARAEADEKLARIEAMMTSQPEHTRKVVEQALAKLEAAMADENDGLTLADAIEQVRTTVRAELKAELDARPSATSLALGGQTGPDGQVIHSAQPIVIVTQGSQGQPMVTRGQTLAAASPAATTASESTETGGAESADGLSETERAYKLAFESGKPVRLGGNKVNPVTGRVAEGRLLDPAAARAAGISDWREWYLMDDFADRMRLQRQAMRYLKDSDVTADTMKLPSRPATPSDPVINAAPVDQ